jgi:anti-sigma factor RsiW
MCDFPGKLIAWLDHELPDGEAADVRRHIEGCVECRSRVAAYQQVSKSVSAYCDEAVATQAARGWVRWELALPARLRPPGVRTRSRHGLSLQFRSPFPRKRCFRRERRRKESILSRNSVLRRMEQRKDCVYSRDL